jgi:hypothetical protein
LRQWLTERESCDVLYAARQLAVSVTPHAVVLARASAAVERIERGIDAAQEQGLLKQFNREYKRRRLLAKARGQGFMGYQRARAKLRTALASAAAKGADVPADELLARVFKR